ncbi:hypothetical protein [Nannocystis pusilla]|uniref:hypothetical protein n=1 Tax=Nannocystis pusilla TaxID=889268 RepID=UPI003B788F3B
MQPLRAPAWALALAASGCGASGGDSATQPTTTDDTSTSTSDGGPTTSTTDTPPTGTTSTDTTASETTEPDPTEATTTTTTTTVGTDTTDGVTSTSTDTTATETAGETTVGTTDGTTDATTETTGEETFVKVQIVAFNDFHGNLEPPSGSGGKIKIDANTSVDAGGAAYLAHHVAALREQNPNTIVVSAGDLIGASPLVSALFHDEPTIEAMNAIGLDYNAVGNHEFDDGANELLRMQGGGCHPIDGCGDDTPFPGPSSSSWPPTC